MSILHLKRPVPDFDRWMKPFDSISMGRMKFSMPRCRTPRAVENQICGTFELDFAAAPLAGDLLSNPRRVRRSVEGMATRSSQALSSKGGESKKIQSIAVCSQTWAVLRS